MSSLEEGKVADMVRQNTNGLTLLRQWMNGQEIYLALIAIALGASLVSPVFFTETNLGNILNQASTLGILACAEFLVVLIGGFDLSVAAVMALGSVLVATIAPSSMFLGAAVAIFSGAGLGLVSGVFVTFGRVAPLIATLGVMGIARGMAFVVSEKSVAVSADLLAPFRHEIWLFSTPVIVWALVTLILAFILARTRFGRNLYAIGGNARAAKLAGIPVRLRMITVYALAGALSGLGGLSLVLRTTSGVPHGGAGWDLDAIAAIVIGGARLFGGEGTILKAMAGVIIYQMISNVMNLVNLDPFYQDIVKALVILVVVGFSVMRQANAQKGIK